MAVAPDTTTGTITLTSGSASFTTSGTNMLTRGHKPGDTIYRNGLVLVIDTIPSENAGTLTDVCPAGAAGVGVAVRIRFQPDGSRVPAQARNLIDAIGDMVSRFVAATATVASKIVLFEGTNNGANKTTLKAADTLGADRTFTLPDVDVTMNTYASQFLDDPNGAAVLATLGGLGLAGGTMTGQLNMNLAPNSGIAVRSSNGTSMVGILYNSSDIALTLGTVTNHPVWLYSNNTYRGAITAAGNLEIVNKIALGAANLVPTSQLHMQAPSGATYGFMSVNNNAAGERIRFTYDVSAVKLGIGVGGTPGTSQLILDSNGLFASLGQTVSGAASMFFAGTQFAAENANAGVWPVGSKGVDRGLLVRLSSASGGFGAYFEVNNTTAVGSISLSGSATAYNTSSDYRLKENVTPLVEFELDADTFDLLGGNLLRVMALRPVTFNWKAEPNGELVHGFIAHEVQSVIPNAVAGEKDAMEAVGTAVVPERVIPGAVVPEHTIPGQVIPEQYVLGDMVPASGDVPAHRPIIDVIPEQRLPDTVVPEVRHPDEVIPEQRSEDIPQSAAPEGSTWSKTGERPMHQGIDTSFLVADLTAAVQELTLLVLAERAERLALEARLTVLEAS